MGVKCISIKNTRSVNAQPDEVPQFDAATVRQALEDIIKDFSRDSE